MNGRPTLLLEHHLKELWLPSFLRGEYGKMAASFQCAVGPAEGVAVPPNLSAAAGRTGAHRHCRNTGAWWSAGSVPPASPAVPELGHLRLHRQSPPCKVLVIAALGLGGPQTAVRDRIGVSQVPSRRQVRE